MSDYPRPLRDRPHRGPSPSVRARVVRFMLRHATDHDLWAELDRRHLPKLTTEHARRWRP